MKILKKSRQLTVTVGLGFFTREDARTLEFSRHFCKLPPRQETRREALLLCFTMVLKAVFKGTIKGDSLTS